jgi:Kdo2-lipid IVA lauroyltransferase/acyltransferase
MWQKVKNLFFYLVIRGLLAAAGLLPQGLALALGGRLGAIFHALASRYRNLARAHLALAYPDQPERKRRRWARSVFISLGRTAMEFMRMTTLPAARIAKLVEAGEGRDYMTAALGKGRGVLCLTAHAGNWEILPIYTSLQGWPSAVVAQKLYDPRLDRLLNGFRERCGVKIIRRGNVTAAIVRCLRANMLLGILNDQDTDVDSRWAPFFGRPAKTPVGMLRLARRTGAAVVPIFIARQPSGRNRVYIQPELQLPSSADEEADLLAGAALCNQAIESFIRRFPEQWVWFHERWKSEKVSQ